MTNVEEQDINEWLVRLEEIRELTSWTETESIIILKELLKYLKINFENNEMNYLEYRKYLINLFYPKENISLYLDDLDQIKQENYLYIHEYLNEIKVKLNAYSISAKLTKNEYSRKYEETFQRGLGL